MYVIKVSDNIARLISSKNNEDVVLGFVYLFSNSNLSLILNSLQSHESLDFSKNVYFQFKGIIFKNKIIKRETPTRLFRSILSIQSVYTNEKLHNGYINVE